MEKINNNVKSKFGILRYFLKGSLFLFILVIVTSFAVTFLSTIVPQIIGFTIDSVIGTEEVPSSFVGIVTALGGIDVLKEKIWIVAVVIGIIALASFIFQYLHRYLATRANQTLMRHMRNSLFTHIQRLPLSWLNEHKTGDIIQRCTSDADTISNFISAQLLSLFRIILLLVLSVTFMFLTDPALAAIALAFVPLILGYSVFFYSKAKSRFQECDEQEGVLSTIAQENLTGVRVVRAFGREKYERDKFEAQNEHYTLLWTRLEKFMAFYWSTSDLLSALQLLCIVCVGTVFCVNGTMTPGNVIAFISYNVLMMNPIRELGRIISNLSKAGVALGRIGEIVNAGEEEYGENEGALTGDIVFDDVSFCYEENKPVLSNVSFTVPKGSTLGIIGGTGSGKSTIAYLLDRLYTPTSGVIRIGNRNLNDIPRLTVRKNMGFILQESYIYSRSVGANIAIASDVDDEESIRAAAKTACVDDAITAFPSGYETIVGERGVTLSGGQKQRVAIARTIMRKTPYILVDDSLSAVDSDTDANIRANLAGTFSDCTTIIISHRITTVMDADNIIVMDGGKIVESGNNESLLKQNGIYKRIYDMQTTLPDDL